MQLFDVNYKICFKHRNICINLSDKMGNLCVNIPKK